MRQCRRCLRPFNEFQTDLEEPGRAPVDPRNGDDRLYWTWISDSD